MSEPQKCGRSDYDEFMNRHALVMGRLRAIVDESGPTQDALRLYRDDQDVAVMRFLLPSLQVSFRMRKVTTSRKILAEIRQRYTNLASLEIRAALDASDEF
ncbi:hypothetical protein FHS21_005657 [Phyllobacterium trifolii]|uniref:Uncharacterized protein n=1 Tax=Phyllobacterium trifolii TaxID=300193 RepID=A0A839UGY7_9HYPH|nr:hypothetical protein [Phyllobacterium trifolii]MBB3149205.1 hypothetical protein [Phyllobacterium trifolii]